MRKTVSIIYFSLLGAAILLMLLSIPGAKAEVMSTAEGAVELPVTEKQIDPDVKEFNLKPEHTDGKNTCVAFFTAHQYIWVYEDDELIFSLEGADSVFGSTPGGGWNFVEVRSDTKEVRVRIEAAYPEVRDYEVTFYQGNAIQMYLNLMRGSVLEVIVSILDLAIGVILLIYYGIASREMDTGKGGLYFGLFSLMMGLWALNETEMMTVLMENRASASYIGYAMIMLMIAPFIFFVREFLEPGKERLSDVIIIISLLNAVVCTALHLSGIREFKQTVLGTHLLMLAALFYLFFALVRRFLRTGPDRTVRTNLLGMLMLTIAFLVDIVAFYSGARKTDVFGRFGFLFYIILLGREVATDTVSKIHEGRKAEVYRELAVKDILTQLYNRNAYDEWAYQNQSPRGTAIITFDLNELKRCNDTYGHAAGDQYIQDAAAMLAKVFEPAGRCFRIGGDEFCAIVEKAKAEWIERRMQELEQLEREYNQTSELVRIQIACGYAIFDEALDRDVEDTRKRADAQMYENKKMQKQG